jgi:hypothetical protein
VPNGLLLFAMPEGCGLRSSNLPDIVLPPC